jgi:hypothetical protein
MPDAEALARIQVGMAERVDAPFEMAVAPVTPPRRGRPPKVRE